MSVLALLLIAAAPSPMAPADADRDVLCYALNASEASNARKAGETDNFNQRLQWSMFFRGVAAERYKTGAEFKTKLTDAIADLATYITNGGKDLLDSECKARMRVAMSD